MDRLKAQIYTFGSFQREVKLCVPIFAPWTKSILVLRKLKVCFIPRPSSWHIEHAITATHVSRTHTPTQRTY